MSYFDKLNRHSDLVSRMADTVGADLADAAAGEQIRPEEMRSMVLRCAACEAPEECEQWLADHADGAATPPPYCRNKALLDRVSSL